MRVILLLSALCAVLSMSGPTWASAKDPKVELRPFFGFRFGGGVTNSGYDSGGATALIDDLDVKPGSQFGLMLNVPVSVLGARDPRNNWLLEAFVAMQPSTLRIDDRSDIDILALNSKFTKDGDKIELFDMDVTYYHVGALYQWTDYSWTPYTNFSIGATNFKPDADLDSKTRFSMGLGGGVKRMFTDHLGFRSQVKGYVTFLGSDGELYCDAFGCWEYEEYINFLQLELSSGLVIAF